VSPKHHRSNLFIVTGGPGSGKTALVGALRDSGVAVAPEAGRAIIRAQRAIGGPARPDGDRMLFAELMLSWDMRSYEAADQAAPVFFDRGIPDTLGYLRLAGLAVPRHVVHAAQSFRYNETAFILPPWPEIYTDDAERKQTLDEAVRTFEALRSTYAGLGYRLIEVPRVAVEQRRSFVLAAMHA
jgi:predicted ATPase